MWHGGERKDFIGKKEKEGRFMLYLVDRSISWRNRRDRKFNHVGGKVMLGGRTRMRSKGLISW